MWVQVRYFAAVRETIGDTAARWELPEGATVGDLWGRLATANPPLRQLTCTAAVNQEYVSPETVLADGDEVVFIPPVSGGVPRPRDVPHPPAPSPPCGEGWIPAFAGMTDGEAGMTIYARISGGSTDGTLPDHS